MTGFPWGYFYLSDLSILNLQQLVNYSSGFPTLWASEITRVYILTPKALPIYHCYKQWLRRNHKTFIKGEMSNTGLKNMSSFRVILLFPGLFSITCYRSPYLPTVVIGEESLDYGVRNVLPSM